MPAPLPRAAALLAAIATVACDVRGGTPVAAARAPRDPCSLITAAEAASLLGTPITVRPARTGGPPACEYAPATGKRLNGFTLSVYWTGGREALATTVAGQSIASDMMQTAEADPSSVMKLERVAGLGDEAYFNPAIGSSVLQDDTLLEFDITAMMWHRKYDEGKALWARLAAVALARLAEGGES